MHEFEISKIAPLQPDLWLAELLVRMPETVGGVDVSQVCVLRVRFSASNDLPSEALLHRAYEAAGAALSKAATLLGDTSPKEFLDAAYEQLRPKSPEELIAENPLPGLT